MRERALVTFSALSAVMKFAGLVVVVLAVGTFCTLAFQVVLTELRKIELYLRAALLVVAWRSCTSCRGFGLTLSIFALTLAFALAAFVRVLSSVLQLWRMIVWALTKCMFLALSVVLP